MNNTNNLNLRSLVRLHELLEKAATAGLGSQVSNFRTYSLKGAAFSRAAAFAGTGLEEQGFTLVAHKGVERNLSLKGVALLNSQARIACVRTPEGAHYSWDLVYSSYFGTKVSAKINPVPSFGDGDAPSVKADGYVIAMATDNGLEPQFAEDAYRGIKEDRVPVNVLLQSSVANLDPQGDAVRAFILDSIIKKAPALLSTNHGLELRIMLFFEDFRLRKHKDGYADASVPYFLMLKGDCFGIWARPFDPASFKTVDHEVSLERLEDYKSRNSIMSKFGNKINGLSEQDYRELCLISGVPYTPREGADKSVQGVVSAPIAENKTLQNLSKTLTAKCPSAEAPVNEFIDEDPANFFDDFVPDEEPLMPAPLPKAAAPAANPADEAPAMAGYVKAKPAQAMPSFWGQGIFADFTNKMRFVAALAVAAGDSAALERAEKHAAEGEAAFKASAWAKAVIAKYEQHWATARTSVESKVAKEAAPALDAVPAKPRAAAPALDSFEGLMAALAPYADKVSNMHKRAYTRIKRNGLPLSEADYAALKNMVGEARGAGFQGKLAGLNALNGQPQPAELDVDAVDCDAPSAAEVADEPLARPRFKA